MKKLTGSLCLLVLLTACTSKEQKEQQMCEANFKEALLNPETAEFHDFKEISALEVEQSFWLSATSKSLVRETWQDMKEEKVPEPGSTFYQMRVRADGQMGNKITKPVLCLLPPSRDRCKCEAVETSFSF